MFRHNKNDVRIYSDRLHRCPRQRPVFLFHSKFQLLEEPRCPLRKTRTVFGSLKDWECCWGSVLGNILRKSTSNTATNHTLAFSLWITRVCWSVTQNWWRKFLVKDFRTFMDRQISTDEKTGTLISSTFFVLNGQRWSEVRTSFRPLFSTGITKTMFFLVDVCGKELAACL